MKNIKAKKKLMMNLKINYSHAKELFLNEYYKLTSNFNVNFAGQQAILV